MLSTTVSIVTASTADVFRTTTMKATSPPGSWTLVGFADLSTQIDDGTSVIVTVASSWSLTSCWSSSCPTAVTTSVFTLPALPEIVRVNLQVYVAPGWIVCGTEHVPLPFKSIGSAGPAPSGSSTSEVIVTGSVDTEVFSTSTVNCTGPPGSGTEVGSAVFVTSIDGATSVISTSASSLSVTVRWSSSCPVTVATLLCSSPAFPVT